MMEVFWSIPWGTILVGVGLFVMMVIKQNKRWAKADKRERRSIKTNCEVEAVLVEFENDVLHRKGLI